MGYDVINCVFQMKDNGKLEVDLVLNGRMLQKAESSALMRQLIAEGQIPDAIVEQLG